MDVALAKRRTQVRQQIHSCRSCALRGACKLPVPFRGPTPALVTLVGEAPGRDEDNANTPFIGASGRMLMNLITEETMLRDEDFFICNTVSCRPPSNRNPYPKEIAACSSNLRAQMALANSKYVLLLGRTALSAFRSDALITKTHGRPFKLGDVTYMPTFHPAAALRDPGTEVAMRHDLTKFFFLLVHNDAFPDDVFAQAARLCAEKLDVIDSNPWPDDCECCDNPVAVYDSMGIAYCVVHDPSRGSIPTGKEATKLRAKKRKEDQKLKKYIPLVKGDV